MSFSYTREQWRQNLEWIAEWCPQEYRVDARRLLKLVGQRETKRIIDERIARRAEVQGATK